MDEKVKEVTEVLLEHFAEELAPVEADTKEAEAKESVTSKPSTGQSGPKLKLRSSDLNDKEKAVLTYLKENVMPATISEISAECFFGVAASEKQANSWVRNSLRRLVRADLVEKISRGVYSSKK